LHGFDPPPSRGEVEAVDIVVYASFPLREEPSRLEAQ